MEPTDLLIVSPTTVIIDTPLLFAQKRMISLLNPTRHRLIFCVELKKDGICKVQPDAGEIRPFTTVEINVTLEPAISKVKSTKFKVKCMTESAVREAEFADFPEHETIVRILFEPASKTYKDEGLANLRAHLRDSIQSKTIKQAVENHLRDPAINEKAEADQEDRLNRNRETPKLSSRLKKGGLWLAFIVVVASATYYYNYFYSIVN